MNRSTIILLFLLLALGAVTYFLLPSGEERQASYDTRGVAVAVDSASVMKIDIKRPLSLTTLQNVGGTWMVTSPYQYAADLSVVNQLVGGLSKFKVGSLVSSNPEKQRLFQVDSLGTSVTLTDRAGASQSFIFGKMGPSFSEVYFRLPDSKDVYLGEGIDSWMLTREPSEWRDKTILAAKTESIRELVYTVGNSASSFVRDSAGWTTGGRRADIDQLSPSLTALMGLKADDFIDTAMQFQNRPLTLQAKGPDEFSLSLYPLDADSSRYAVQSSKTPQLFVVGKYAVSQLMRPAESAPRSGRQIAAAPPAKKQQRPPVAAKKQPVAAKQAPAKTPPKATARKETPKTTTQPPPAAKGGVAQRPPAAAPQQTRTTPAVTPAKPAAGQSDDEGELNVHAVKRGETMTTIAKKYNVTVDQIIKWNQLKSISVRPGQELYVFVRK